MFRLICIAISVLALSGCISVPAANKGVTHLELDSPVPYTDAYRMVARQMRACYRVIGIFGNGYDIQADLDSEAKQGRIELYAVGLTGAKPAGSDNIARTVTIADHDGGSHIVVDGYKDRYVYLTHKAVAGWLNGGTNCAGE